MAIDVHAHCVPDGLVEAASRLGVELPPMEPLLFDLPARFEAMDRMRMDRQVLSPFIALTADELPGLDGTTGPRYCRVANELMARTVSYAPTRLSGLATVPLWSGKEAAGELAHAVGQLGLAGVEIGTRTATGHLDAPEMGAFWQAAEELECLVLVHPNASGRNAEPYCLGNFVGNPAETTMAAARLMFGGVLDDHPGLRVGLVHGGGFLPYQLGRLERGFEAYAGQRGARLRSAPSQLVDRLWFDTVLHSVEMIRALVDLVGAERVLLGSDYPFEMADYDPLATLAGVAGLTEDERWLIAGENAELLMGSAVDRRAATGRG